MSAAREKTSGLVVRGASDLRGFLPFIEPCDVLLLAGDLVPLDVQEDTGLSRDDSQTCSQNGSTTCPLTKS
jgi:hypothetical protein